MYIRSNFLMLRSMYPSKIISFFIIAVAFIGVSCSKHNENKLNKKDQFITYEELHPDARTFISDHFSAYSVDKIKVKPRDADEYYKVYFSGCRLKIEFNRNGEWQEVDGKHASIPTSFIIPEILDYVSSNYPSIALESIDRKRYGYKVELLNDVELRFNAQGTFLGVDHD